MTDQFLILIPTDPHYLPPSEKADAAQCYIESVLPAEYVVWVWSDTVEFVDSGDNFHRVLCPVCGREVHLHDWQLMMDAAFSNQFAELHTALPCCGAVRSLNELHYDWPAGFARFTLEALNPTADLDDQQLYTLEGMLGSPIRKIWRSL